MNALRRGAVVCYTLAVLAASCVPFFSQSLRPVWSRVALEPHLGFGAISSSRSARHSMNAQARRKLQYSHWPQSPSEQHEGWCGMSTQGSMPSLRHSMAYATDAIPRASTSGGSWRLSRFSTRSTAPATAMAMASLAPRSATSDSAICLSSSDMLISGLLHSIWDGPGSAVPQSDHLLGTVLRYLSGYRLMGRPSVALPPETSPGSVLVLGCSWTDRKGQYRWVRSDIRRSRSSRS